MAREQRNNDGALFKNDRKTAENHPDYTGSAVIEGVEYWVSAWVKTSQAGKKFFSMAYKPKQEQGAAARSAPGASSRRGSDFDDFLPD
jgi:uncharacterized protein (DUF736 family)